MTLIATLLALIRARHFVGAPGHKMSGSAINIGMPSLVDDIYRLKCSNLYSKAKARAMEFLGKLGRAMIVLKKPNSTRVCVYICNASGVLKVLLKSSTTALH